MPAEPAAAKATEPANTTVPILWLEMDCNCRSPMAVIEVFVEDASTNA